MKHGGNGMETYTIIQGGMKGKGCRRKRNRSGAKSDLVREFQAFTA